MTTNVYLQVESYKLIEFYNSRQPVVPLTGYDVLPFVRIFTADGKESGYPVSEYSIPVEVGLQINFAILPAALTASHLLYYKGFETPKDDKNIVLKFEEIHPYAISMTGIVEVAKENTVTNFRLLSAISYKKTGSDDIIIIPFPIDPVLRANQGIIPAPESITNKTQLA